MSDWVDELRNQRPLDDEPADLNGNGVEAQAAELPPQPRDDVGKKAVLLRLTIRSWGIRRSLPKALIEVDADKSLIHAGKDILDKDVLSEIRALDGSIRAYLGERAFPSQFKSGVYLIPIKLVDEIDATLQKKLKRRAELIETFLDQYPRAVDAAKERLRAAFNAADYPSVESLRASFTLTYSYFTFDAPERLKEISRVIFERETENAREWWKQAKEEAQAVLREAMKELTKHLLDRLNNETEEGRLKGFRESAVNGLQKFLDEFAVRNIGDDAELQQVVARASALLKGVDAEGLKNNLGIREQVKAGLADVKEQLDKLVVDKPARRILLDDDE